MGGPTLLVNMLSYSVTNVQLAAADAIRELARNVANRDRIIDCDGLPALLSALHNGHPSVKRRVKITLDLLAEDPNYRAAIDSAKMTSLVEQLQLSSGGEDQAGVANATLREIALACRANLNNRENMAAAGGIAETITVLRQTRAESQSVGGTPNALRSTSH